MKVLTIVCALLIACSGFAQNAAAERAHIVFTFENPQAQPATYSVVIYEDGSGSYRDSGAAGGPSQEGGRPIHIDGALASSFFQAARARHFFAVACESRQRDVAFTGKKTLAYAGPDGGGSCTFNYSRDESLNKIAGELGAVSYTLEEGTRLKSEHLHDRLSLDSELASLQEAAQDRRALDLGNISEELESIANDDAVMERARARARSMLAESTSVH